MWTPPPAISAKERGSHLPQVRGPGHPARGPAPSRPCVSAGGPPGAACWCAAAHTEAVVDLCRLAGLAPCGLCCEIMREDGTMMRTTELLEKAPGVGLEGADDSGDSGLLPPPRQARRAGGRCPSAHEVWVVSDLRLYKRPDRRTPRGPREGGRSGDGKKRAVPRPFTKCLTGRRVRFETVRDCGDQLAAAMRQIEAEGRGVAVVYAPGGAGDPA